MQMMLDKSPNERSGIISTVQGFLKVYRDPHIAAATSRSDFRIADLMNHERPVSLYLVIPVKDMDRLQPLLRLVLNQIVKGLTPRMEGEQPRRKLLLMLDEFCVLGHMELLIEDASIRSRLRNSRLRSCAESHADRGRLRTRSTDSTDLRNATGVDAKPG